jgi:hypothetical protein
LISGLFPHDGTLFAFQCYEHPRRVLGLPAPVNHARRRANGRLAAAPKDTGCMKPELNVNVCQIIPRNTDDDVAWVFIQVENLLPDAGGSHARINIEIPVRLDACANQALAESEAISRAKVLLSSAIADL